jgi:hypothetical protein
MGDSREFEFEGAASPSEAADTLARIAEGIRARGLSLSMGDERITVNLRCLPRSRAFHRRAPKWAG